ncbi:MAG: lysine exporter [Deferribacteraceae bacterium]|jgi:L-lysine exporter family protein LysE/ArgO|nr:lysine exporter [Deferribacteraceae bacterium]
MNSVSALVSGFSLGLSLILAIGAQNAFVIKYGILNRYIFTICFICSLSDAVLIFLGVSGFGIIIKQYHSIIIVAKYFGIIFLAYYGALNIYSAFAKSHSVEFNKNNQESYKKVILTCLGFTWLNPHVYLDTVFLLGSISVQFKQYKYHFALGAMLASLSFFFSLGYLARLIAPIFKNALSWKTFEILIAGIMFYIAYKIYKI